MVIHTKCALGQLRKKSSKSNNWWNRNKSAIEYTICGFTSAII